MSGNEWDGRDRQDYIEIRRIVREETAASSDSLHKRVHALELKIAQWEDRAGFVRTIVVAAAMTTGTLIAALEWVRTHLALK